MGKNWLYYVIIAKKHRFWLKVKPKSNHKLKNYKKCPSLVGEACEDKPNLRLYGQTLGNNKRVKVDISRSEQLVFEPVMKDVFVDYTDLEAYQLLCYPLEEVLVEKMRSVMQRMQARDFYDIWYLLEEHGMDADFYLNEFEAKCKSKDLLHTDFSKKLTERLPQYKGRWQSSMSEQIKDLPDFDQVEREVKKHIKKLKL